MIFRKIILTGFLLMLAGTLFVFGQSRKDTFLQVAAFTLYFDYKSDLVTDSAQMRIIQVTDSLAKYTDKQFFLSAHTSQSGSSNYNRQLSERRLDAVRRVLLGMGIDSLKIKGAAYGKDKPLISGKTEEQQAINRRVEVIVQRRFLLTPLEGRIRLDSAALSKPAWVLGSNRFFKDSVLTNEAGLFSMWVPDFLPITLSCFVPGYAADVVELMVDSRKSKPYAELPMIPLKTGQPIYFHSIQFYGNKNIFLPKSMEALENLGTQLIRNRDYCFEIQGHVNAPGVPVSQVMTYMDLSKARAGRVYEWLIGRGMSAARMIPTGYGHAKMLYPDAVAESDQQKNRRVEILILDCNEVAVRRSAFREEEFLQLANDPLYNDFRVNVKKSN